MSSICPFCSWWIYENENITIDNLVAEPKKKAKKSIASCQISIWMSHSDFERNVWHTNVMSFGGIPTQRGKVTREREKYRDHNHNHELNGKWCCQNTLERNGTENVKIRSMRPRNCHVPRFYYYFGCDAMLFEHHRINRILSSMRCKRQQ